MNYRHVCFADAPSPHKMHIIWQNHVSRRSINICYNDPLSLKKWTKHLSFTKCGGREVWCYVPHLPERGGSVHSPPHLPRRIDAHDLHDSARVSHWWIQYRCWVIKKDHKWDFVSNCFFNQCMFLWKSCPATIKSLCHERYSLCIFINPKTNLSLANFLLFFFSDIKIRGRFSNSMVSCN